MLSIPTEHDFLGLVKRIEETEDAVAQLKTENLELKARVSALEEGDIESTSSSQSSSHSSGSSSTSHPVVLPSTITVGPGKDFEDLVDLPPIPKDTTVVVYGRTEPYRSKVGLLNDNITLRGENRPTLSGDQCRVPQSLSTVSSAALGSSIVYTGIAKGIKILGIDFEDVWEHHETIFLNQSRQFYPGGSSAVSSHGGDVAIEDSNFRRLIHAIYCKPVKAPMTLLAMKDCLITQCGNESGSRDEAMYPHGNEVYFENVTIKNNRNLGTSTFHCRVDKFTFKNCHMEAKEGVIIFADSSEHGKTPTGLGRIIGGKYISYGGAVFFKLHSDIGPDLGIRRLEVDDALIVGVGSSRFRRTIGTPVFIGNVIRYQNCTFVEMPPADQDKGTTALEYIDDYSSGVIEIGPGNKEYIFRRDGRFYGSPEKMFPLNWQDLIEVHNEQTYQELVKFLP